MGGNGFSSIRNFDALREAGFSEPQARAILEMMSQDSASKADLEYATAELKRDIETTKAELKRTSRRRRPNSSGTSRRWNSP